MFSFYVHLEDSAELRAIRFSLEKSKGKDAIDFLMRIKDMIAATLSVNASTMVMDENWIEPIHLSQIFSAIYEDKTVTKMYLLSNVKLRSDERGIGSGDFAAMLLVDFIRSREKEEYYLKSKSKKSSAEKDKNKFIKLGREQMYTTSQSGKLDEVDQFGTLHTQDLFSSPKKNTFEFSSPHRPMTETKSSNVTGDFEWASQKNTVSERKAKTNQQIKKEQREKMM